MKGIRDIPAADITGEWEIGKHTGRRTSPIPEPSARLALILYESHGKQDGHDIEDWLRAEQELIRHYT